MLCCFGDTKSPITVEHEQSHGGLPWAHSEKLNVYSSTPPVPVPIIIPVLQFDGSTCKKAAVVTISAPESVVAEMQPACPQVILRLQPVPSSGSLDTRAGTLDLPVPTIDNPKFLLSAQPLFANEAAKIAWAAAEASEIAQSLKELSRTDPGFLSILAEVASSVAAPIQGAGFTSPVACSQRTYVPVAGALALIPDAAAGSTSITVSSSYVRSQDDASGTLSPVLVIELLLGSNERVEHQQIKATKDGGSSRLIDSSVAESGTCPPMQHNMNLKQSHDVSTMTSVDYILPSREMSDLGEMTDSDMVKEIPQSLHGQSNQPTQPVHWNLKRAGAMMSAMPCITTLLELSVEHSGEGDQDDAIKPDMLKGRVLFQNEQSLSYWGKLDTTVDTGSCMLLSALFKDETSDELHGFIKHLNSQRIHQELFPNELLITAPWKKAMQVPATFHSVSQELRKQRRKGMPSSKEIKGMVPDLKHKEDHLDGENNSDGVRLKPIKPPALHSSLSVDHGGCFAGGVKVSSSQRSTLSGPWALLTSHNPPTSCSSTPVNLQSPLGCLGTQMNIRKLHSSPLEPSSSVSMSPLAKHQTSSQGSNLYSSSGLFEDCRGPQSNLEQVLDQVGLAASPSHRLLSFMVAMESGRGKQMTEAEIVTHQEDLLDSLEDAFLPSLSQAECTLQPFLSSQSAFGSNIPLQEFMSLDSKSISESSVMSLLGPQKSRTPFYSSRAQLRLGRGMHSRPLSLSPSAESATTADTISCHTLGQSQQRHHPSTEVSRSSGASRQTLVGEYLSLRSSSIHNSLASIESLPLSIKRRLSSGLEGSFAMDPKNGHPQMRNSDHIQDHNVLEMDGSDKYDIESDDDGSVEACSAERGLFSRWHEVQAHSFQDPVTGKEAVVLLQTDITARAIMEMRIAALTEAQLAMLENMFPRHILEFIMGPSLSQASLGSLAYQHQDVTILFMDIVGFTTMSKEVPPQMVMEFVNTLFSKFDDLCDSFGVYKVETAGDCYIVAGALMASDDDGFVSLDPNPDGRKGAKKVVEFAQAMLCHALTVPMPHNGEPTSVRVGIHTGSVVSGLIGTKQPKFSLFGDTMNTSSRMESTGKPGCIQISETTYDTLDVETRAVFLPTGGVEVKGKGKMSTFLYEPKEEDLRLRPEDLGIIQEGVEMEEEADNYIGIVPPPQSTQTSLLAATELHHGRTVVASVTPQSDPIDSSIMPSSSIYAMSGHTVALTQALSQLSRFNSGEYPCVQEKHSASTLPVVSPGSKPATSAGSGKQDLSNGSTGSQALAKSENSLTSGNQHIIGSISDTNSRRGPLVPEGASRAQRGSSGAAIPHIRSNQEKEWILGSSRNPSDPLLDVKGMHAIRRSVSIDAGHRSPRRSLTAASAQAEVLGSVMKHHSDRRGFGTPSGSRASTSGWDGLAPLPGRTSFDLNLQASLARVGHQLDRLSSRESQKTGDQCPDIPKISALSSQPGDGGRGSRPVPAKQASAPSLVNIDRAGLLFSGRIPEHRGGKAESPERSTAGDTGSRGSDRLRPHGSASERSSLMLMRDILQLMQATVEEAKRQSN